MLEGSGKNRRGSTDPMWDRKDFIEVKHVYELFSPETDGVRLMGLRWSVIGTPPKHILIGNPWHQGQSKYELVLWTFSNFKSQW
jgi:hypothetical protein